MMPMPRLAALLLPFASMSAAEAQPSRPAGPPLAAVTVVGPPETVFARAQACDGHDVPDTAARAYRDERGHVVVFALHYENRRLQGESLDRLTLDCRVVLSSPGRGEPEAYEDRSWITATWTEDGRRVEALIHHEFQAHRHPGRCTSKEYMACWHNAVLQRTSFDGGLSFPPATPPRVVATTPFGQEVGQGRHRGFFNPSNIVGAGRYRYFFAATTGWPGQPFGACLFRSDAPSDPTSWRAFDGQGFTVRFGDPYRKGETPKAACRPIPPFPAPVGAVVRHRRTGAYVAVFQASANGDAFPEPGFYATSSRDLLTWDKPRLVLAGRTLYDDPCGAETLIAYPSLLDRRAEGRNFDDVGDEAELYFTRLKVEGCRVTSERDLLRRRVAIKVWG